MSADRRHWAQINEVSFVAGMKFLFLVFRWFGRWPFRFFLYPVVLFYVLRNPRARAASRGYLDRVLPGRASTWLMVRHFIAFAEALLDKLRVWSGKLDVGQVTRHNQQHFAEQQAQGRGGLIITGHLGNVELCRALSKTRQGLRLTILVHTKHAQAFNKLLAELNPESMLNLWQVTDMSPDVAIRLAEKVNAGEFVVIAGDRVPVSPNPRVAWADFLGQRAAFPVGPYVLASLLQCPTYLLFCVQRDGGYHVYYELFREQIKLPRRERDAAFAELAADYAERLAHYCRLAPLQWFNFYDFWAPPQAVTHDAPN